MLHISAPGMYPSSFLSPQCATTQAKVMSDQTAAMQAQLASPGLVSAMGAYLSQGTGEQANVSLQLQPPQLCEPLQLQHRLQPFHHLGPAHDQPAHSSSLRLRTG